MFKRMINCSIEKSKKDMQDSHPMDRLWLEMLVFGRAWGLQYVTKAVNDHKQVVVPSSDDGLAQQHYTNFKERFQKFCTLILMY